ncbi:MAG TPA: hypothetical protein VL633_10040 [Bacteroidota bacterium]|nr:hypothetical protein [Bacteroidota bacterium]
MQNNNHQRKHVRGSSPHEEMKEGFKRWVRNLRSIEPAQEDPATPSRILDQSKEQKNPVADQPDAEGRWHDDGGSGG